MTENVPTWIVFPDPLVPTSESLPRRIQHMHARFGITDDKKCGDCVHLEVHHYHLHNYYKCILSNVSSSAATDWRRKWPACGKFEVVAYE